MPTEQGPITLVLATDSFLIGDGLACMLAGADEVQVVGRAGDTDELVSMVDRLGPEAVLISIRAGVATTPAPIAVARRLRDAHPDLGIVVISDRGNGFALELLRGGARRIAYLLDERLPGMDAVLGALHELRTGQSVLDPSIVDALVRRRDVTTVDDLSPRETDVLELVAQGLSNRTIADELHVSVKGVEKHVTTIFRKLGLTEQTTIDRRVSAALACLRSQNQPFDSGSGPAGAGS